MIWRQCRLALYREVEFIPLLSKKFTPFVILKVIRRNVLDHIGHKLEWFFNNGGIVYKYKKDYLCLKSRYCLFVWHIQVLFYAFATQTYPLQNFLTNSLILSKLSAYTKHKVYFVVSRVQFLCNNICWKTLQWYGFIFN